MNPRQKAHSVTGERKMDHWSVSKYKLFFFRLMHNASGLGAWEWGRVLAWGFGTVLMEIRRNHEGSRDWHRTKPSDQGTKLVATDMRAFHCTLENRKGEAPGWLSGRASAFGSGHDPGFLGLNPTSGFLWEACFSFCLCLRLFLCLS